VDVFDGDKNPFIGEFSDFAIYEGSTLSSSEVSDLYALGPGTVVIPEPSSLILLGLAFGALFVVKRAL
jgi:hypothetical protein